MKKTYRFPYVHYPLLPVQFFHKGRKTPVIAALIDSGGDSVVIPRAIADYLGVETERTEKAKTAAGFTSIERTKLKMIIGKNEIIYKDVDVFVINNNDMPVLLGREPLFEDFEITFRKKKREIVLTEA
ncbi:MAG: aspartyl protease [Thermoplasmata archaeon]|nr:MAG: aspartyl protease [Thermoplasmata archaeon]RLF52957.1 MAG: aspartyl protease [Thermoplasmata archaeon]